MVDGGREVTLLVSERRNLRTFEDLAQASRELIREELLEVAHPKSRERLKGLDWRGVFIEVAYQRWRIPAARPRIVDICPEFLEDLRQADRKTKAGMRDVLVRLETGKDLTDLISERAMKSKPKERDRFLSDWHLHHLHVYPQSGDLIFAHIDDQIARLVALRPHGNWAELEIAHRCQRNWPGVILLEPIGDFRPSVTVSDEDLRELQHAGVTTLISSVDGRAMLGRGQTTTGHPLFLIEAANALAWRLNELECGRVSGITRPSDWRPYLTEDLTRLGMWREHSQQLIPVAGLIPARAW